MRLLSTFLSIICFIAVVDAQTPPRLPPPAGRALLFRSAHLEPWDFPASARSGFDTRLHQHNDYSVLGPPDFWTEPSLRSHYLSTLHLRYHPQLYPVPPPFEVWLKEQKLIRAINMQMSVIKIELTREDVSQDALLHHEMQLGELSALLRQLQIATALEYASLAPEWRKFETAMYRYWGSFLAVSQKEKAENYGLQHWLDHLAYVEKLAKERAEEEQRERLQQEAEAKGRMKSEEMRYGQGQGKGEKGGWTEVKIERGDLESSTPRRWFHTPEIGSSSSGASNRAGKGGLASGTPRRWSATPELVSSGDEDVMTGLREAFGKGFHL